MFARGVLALKVKDDKEGIKKFAYQVYRLTTECIKSDIKIVDCVVTSGGVKNFAREITKLSDRKQFDYLLIYSPQQIAKDAAEFRAFAKMLKEDFDVGIKMLRG